MFQLFLRWISISDKVVHLLNNSRNEYEIDSPIHFCLSSARIWTADLKKVQERLRFRLDSTVSTLSHHFESHSRVLSSQRDGAGMLRLFSPSICFHLRSDLHSILQSLFIPFHHHSELHFRCQERPRACRTNRVSSTSRLFLCAIVRQCWEQHNITRFHIVTGISYFLLFGLVFEYFGCERLSWNSFWCNRRTSSNPDHLQSHLHLSFPHHIPDAPPRRHFHHATLFITSCCSSTEETVVKYLKTLQFFVLLGYIKCFIVQFELSH